MFVKDLIKIKRQLERELHQAEKKKDFAKIWEITCKLNGLDVRECSDYVAARISKADEAAIANGLVETEVMFDCANGVLMQLEATLKRVFGDTEFMSKPLKNLALCRKIVHESVKRVIDNCPQLKNDFSNRYGDITEEIDKWLADYLPNKVKLTINKHMTIS